MKNQSETVELSAQEQCRAVLSVWTEQRTIERACRELGVKRTQLMQWQERAMSGMVQALSPRDVQEERSPALAVVVRHLVERIAAENEGQAPRLARRLARVAEARPAAAGE